MEKKHLYIVLTRPDTIISKIIRYIKKDDYSHASISLDRDFEKMYSFGRKNKYNPFIGGFVKEDFDKGVYGFCKVLNGIVIEIDVSNEQYEKAKNIINEFILKKEDYKYNYLGLFYHLINKEAYIKDRFSCSEFVYYILNKIDAVYLNIPKNLVRPQDLININGNIIYKGNLKNLKKYRKILEISKERQMYNYVA